MRTNAVEERAELSPVASSTATPRQASPQWSDACLACDRPLNGPFCSNCGQRAVPPNPTLRELGGEAFAEFSGWDGKFADTIRTLIWRPGQLTLKFLRGKRSQYITPLRLYLSCSLVYFVLAAANRSSVERAGRGGPGIVVTTTQPNGSAKALDLSRGVGGISAEDRETIRAAIESAPALLRPVARRILEDKKGFQQDVFNALPKGLFVLLPAFAGILTLLYRRRHYAEHLYFAMHLHAFTFLALAVTALVKWVPSALVIGVTGVAAMLWISVYTHVALRRVYGGSFAGTLVKEAAMGVLYFAAFIPVLIGLAVWVARA
ncbi:MAG TPA: DUF3667 domain-containing protein [Gemmatimonadaceae bacterium]|nr:DUF3667 domain-containing protein [Gemmatimonadaceae bacterium]